MIKVKEKSLSVLIHEMDVVFSRFIRTRDTHNGVIQCFVCGTKMAFQEAQCGHFIERDKMPTRYDEMNCNSVCEGCNCYDLDHNGRYLDKLIEKYHVPAVQELAARSYGLQKYMRHELLEMIERYKLKIKELKK